MVFFFDIATAPFDRLAVTIIGSISGVRPTATDTAKMKASSQSPLVIPLIRKTKGIITSINRMSRKLTLLIPLSKAVAARCPAILRAMVPRYVLFPVAITIPTPEPLTTLEPMKLILPNSTTLPLFAPLQSGVFSIGSDSPVSDAWLTNKSLASTIRTSAGIISPAAILTTSPGTSSVMLISHVSSLSCLITLHVFVTIFSKASLDTFAFHSCQKRSIELDTTITDMIIMAVQSCSPGAAIATSSTNETMTSMVRTPINGFMNALTKVDTGFFFFSCSTSFAPYSERRISTSSVESPRGLV